MSRKSKESIKRLLAIALTFVMVAGLLPFTSVSAYAEETPAPDQTTDLVEPTDGQPKQTDGTEDIKDEPTPLDAGDTTTDPTTDPVVTMNPVEGLVYDGTEKQLITAAEVKENYTAKYTVTKDGVDVTAQPVDDITAVKVIAAGTYEIMASITAEDGTVTTEGPVSVTIAKAESDKTITFTDKDGAAIEHNAEISDTITADTYTTTVNITEAYTEGTTAGLISFELKAEDTEIDASSYSYAYNAGVLTLTMKDAGEYKLTATVKGDNNHEDSTAALKFIINAEKNEGGNHCVVVDNLTLPQTVKLDTSGNFIFTVKYEVINGNRGNVTAQIDGSLFTVKNDYSNLTKKGTVTLTAKRENLDELAKLIDDNGSVELKLEKEAKRNSPHDSVTVTVTFKYADCPVTMNDFQFNGGALKNGWYVKDEDGNCAQVVTAASNITISDKLSGRFDGNTCALPEGKDTKPMVFVKNTNGEISRCEVTDSPVNADYTAPEIKLNALEGNSIFDTIWNNITFGTAGKGEAGEGNAYTDDGKYKLLLSASDNIELADVRVVVKTTSLQEIKTALADETGKPAAPGEGATTEENEAYNAALAAWTVGKINESLEKHAKEFPYTDDCVGKIKFETDLSVDANQICKIEYSAVDKAGNISESHAVKNFDDNGNIYKYLLIDNTAPKITLTCGDKTVVEPDQDGVDPVKYYTNKLDIASIVATVEEDNYEFISDSKVLTLNVKDKDNKEVSSIADTERGKSVEIKDLKVDANSEYTVTATCTDANGNATTITMIIVVDTEAPVPSIALPENASVKKYDEDKDTYYDTYYFNKDLALVLNVTDANPGTEMEVAPWKDAAFDKVSLSDRTGTYMVTKDGEYKFSLKHTDAAKNTREKEDSITYIRDTVKPTVAVDLGGAARVEGDTHYYNGDINATVNVTEQYFDAGLIETKVDGTRRDVAFKTNADTNVSTSPVKITGDGEHRLSVSGSDKAGNKMEAYNSPRLVIDTTIHAPVIGGVANGKAYKDKDIAVNVTGDDTNLDAITVKITKATKDGTETVYSVSEANRSFTYAVPAGQAADGVYTVEATIRDKANNTAAAQTVTFTVNRFGSVYEFGAGVSDINGSHVKAVDNDIVISEYSVNKLKTPLEDNVKISINGKPVSSADVKVQEEHRAGGWYKYTYVIAATSFADDGYYKVEVSSTDSESGKTSGTARYADMGLAFFKDGTKPMIESVLGMEKPTYNENEHSIDFDVYDAIGLASVKVYVDGKEVFSQTDFEDASAFSGKIVLGELSSRQHIRFEIEDLAGNITNTDDDIEPFAPEFEFVPDITVSTNFFVRWYAQPGLFWGTVIGGAALIALVVILIAKKKKTGGEEE